MVTGGVKTPPAKWLCLFEYLASSPPEVNGLYSGDLLDSSYLIVFNIVALLPIEWVKIEKEVV